MDRQDLVLAILDPNFLSYQISLKDLEKQLRMTIVPDDSIRLQRHCAQKQRYPFLRAMLENSKTMQHPYALVPSLSRYIKKGQVVKT